MDRLGCLVMTMSIVSVLYMIVFLTYVLYTYDSHPVEITERIDGDM